LVEEVLLFSYIKQTYINRKFSIIFTTFSLMKKIFFLLLFPIITYSQSVFKEVDSLFDQKKYVKAERLILLYVEDNSNDLIALELLGDAFGYQRKWDDAIKYYKVLVKANNTHANYHYKYGGALGMKALSISKFRALGMISKIKTAFITASRLDTQHIDTRWALVELYMQLPGFIGGSKRKSLKYADELEALSQVDGYLAKGYIYEYDDEPELAETFYKKAIRAGGSLSCFEKLTNLYENEAQPEKAIANIELAQTKHQRNALHYQIGKVCAEYNLQLDKGTQCLITYIKNHSPRDGVPIKWAYYRLAQIYKHQNNKMEALKWIDKALEIQTNFKQALKEKEIISRL